ncbi:hypothetical protein J4470_01330 [Candidatus Woesearchaeota archaeon]|nr:hypothetical protein [Candidatus Woesearchaeota archaeon]
MEMVLDFISAGLECYLQRCSNCNSVLNYGTNTKFDKELLAHICTTCGQVVR